MLPMLSYVEVMGVKHREKQGQNVPTLTVKGLGVGSLRTTQFLNTRC